MRQSMCLRQKNHSLFAILLSTQLVGVTIFVTTILFANTPLHANEIDSPIAISLCSDSLTKENQAKCAKLNLSIEELRLNQSYQLLRQYIDEHDKDELESVQLAWLNYVDQTCHFNVRHLSHVKDTPEYQIAFDDCLAHHTHQRRVELDEAYRYIMYRY